jgi:hypothetical protein
LLYQLSYAPTLSEFNTLSGTPIGRAAFAAFSRPGHDPGVESTKPESQRAFHQRKPPLAPLPLIFRRFVQPLKCPVWQGIQPQQPLTGASPVHTMVAESPRRLSMPKNRIGVLLASFLSMVFTLTLTALPAQATLRTVNAPNAFETDCNDINTANIVVGFFIDNNGVTHGFAIEDGGFKIINAHGSTSTLLYGINNHNQAVGWYIDHSNITHGLMIDSTGQTTI